MKALTQLELKKILPRIKGSDHSIVLIDEKSKHVEKTFNDLHQDTTRLVDELKKIGVVAGSRISIHAPNCYEWLVWDLAIIEAECISVALPQEPNQEPIEEIMSKYTLSLYVYSSIYNSENNSDITGAVLISDFDDLSRNHPIKPLLHPPLTHKPNTHSLVFSSGTSGKLKGLTITSNGTELLLNLYKDAFGVSNNEKILNFLQFSNYQQRMIYYLCLFYGINYVSVSHNILFQSLKMHKPTVVIAPPVFFETLHRMAGIPNPINKTDDDNSRLEELLGGNIRYLITGMAAIKKETLDYFFDLNIPLYEAYGITEAGMVAWNKPGKYKLGTVGQPAQSNSVYLNEENEVIVKRDALLSSGYFEASEHDINNTFIGSNEIATGDIAVFDDNGFLKIIGRKKDAIITKGGDKFHPESIERLIQEETNIDLVIVIPRTNMAGVASILFTSEENFIYYKSTIKESINKINKSLPAFKKIKKIIFSNVEPSVDNELRTKNMKLNRKRIEGYFQDFASKSSPNMEEVLK